MKKAISILLTVLMLIGIIAPMAVFAADTDYNLYYTFSDIQVNKTSPDQRYGSNNNHINSQLLYYINGGHAVYLAKNEIEGFQAVFFEKGEGRTLDIEYTPFVNEQGELLECKVYNELFIVSTGVSDYKLADALVPYNHEGVQTTKNENNAFFFELHSKKDQTPGQYVSTITLKDENGILRTQKVTAVVWNFSLPEGHLSTYLVGNYNSASGYYATSGFLRLAGIRFDANGIVEEDKERAEEILEAYDEFFLEHGVTPYELPAYIIEKDSKEAELAMADPRRSMFMVPVTSYARSNGELTNTNTVNTINSYKAIVKGNQILEDKAFFYPMDEPTWKNESEAADYLARVDALKNIWGDNYHSIVPFFSADASSYTYNVIKSTSDIFCPNQSTVSNTNSANDNDSKRTFRAELGSDEWHKTLRYQGDTWQGNTYLYNYARSTKGVFTRLLQWQASALNSDGMLHWNGLYVPNKADGTPYDVFENYALSKPAGPSTGNGDGIYVYSGVSLGYDATTPIASLRLKHIQSGMDDFDYLSLTKEFLGEEAYTEYMNAFLRNYKEAGTDQIWYCERNEGKGWDGDWITWEIMTLNHTRVVMGNALSAANTENAFEHDFGDWETTVTPDEMHNGLEIRTCATCGAQETNKLEKLTCKHESTTVIPAVEASCTKTGLTEGKKCSVCGVVLTEQTTVEMKAHTEVVLPAVSATCTATGLTEGKKCSVCEKVLKEQTKTEKLPHADNDGDNLCDTCGKDLSVKCSCNCHKTGFMGFLWKIMRLFYKLFGTNKTCACGAAHY